MSPLVFIKVIMATVFMLNGDIIVTKWVDTNYDKCERAQEAAVRFNDRLLMPWEDDREIYVQCFWDDEITKEA